MFGLVFHFGVKGKTPAVLAVFKQYLPEKRSQTNLPVHIKIKSLFV